MYPVRKLLSNGRFVQSGVRAMSAKGPLVDFAVDNDGIAVVTMQRPPVNSLNLDLLEAMSKSLDDVAKNKCKGMILTSVCYFIYLIYQELRFSSAAIIIYFKNYCKYNKF